MSFDNSCLHAMTSFSASVSIFVPHSKQNFAFAGKALPHFGQEAEFCCADCTDCVMKQIVELCEEESSLVQHKQKVKVKGLNKLADKILELLDKQEVE